MTVRVIFDRYRSNPCKAGAHDWCPGNCGCGCHVYKEEEEKG